MTIDNTVSEILEEGHIESMRTTRTACIKKLKERRSVAFDAPLSLTTELGKEREVKSS